MTVTNPPDSSDLAGSFTGFRLHYTTEQTGSLCQGVHQEFKPRGTLKSVHIPEKYTRMLTCSWIVTTPAPDKAVTVQVTHMKISDDCEKDYVSIIDGKSQADREVARFVSILSSENLRDNTCQSMPITKLSIFTLRAVGIFQESDAQKSHLIYFRICGSQRISKSFTSTKQTMFIMLHLDEPNPHNYITIKWHSEPGCVGGV